MSMLSDRVQFAMAGTFIADSYNNGRDTKPVNMANYKHCTFVLVHGTGTAGQPDITAKFASDASKTNALPVPFRYKKLTGADAADLFAGIARATSAGIVGDAGSHQLYLIELDAAEAEALNTSTVVDRPWAYLSLGEHTDGAVIGGVIAILSGPRFAQDVLPSAFV